MSNDLISFPLTQPVVIFMLVLVIILLTPILFRKLKVPHVVGLILVGVAVGPYGFNLLARDASFEIFGQVGILYLMFLAAAEIDMYHLRRNWKLGGIFGLLTFVIPMGVGIPVTHYLLGASWLSSVLISSMFASHTLITYPVVSRFGLSNNRGAIVAVTGTIVAVMLALMALAEVVDIARTDVFNFSRLMVLIGLMIVYALLVGWLFPLLTRYFFRKVGDDVAQFIFILTLVFVSSVLAKFIGLESILGAFYAGLVLNKFIPGRSALMNRIKFVGNALFIPYFLIGVGMLINVRVVFAGWSVLWTAAIMTLTALLTKWASAYLGGRVCGLNGEERRLMFGLTSGKAAATIAATMLGYQYGLLSENMMNGAVVMILICCIVASVTTENAAKEIRIARTAEELDADGPQKVGFARQLVAVSNPLTAEGIMRMAVFMRHPDNKDSITALFVRSGDSGAGVRMGREALDKAQGVAESMNIGCDVVERYDLNVMAGISNAMRERHASEVIIGMHRKGNIVDSFFGSMIVQLMNTTSKMIIMSRCFSPIDTIGKIVVYVPQNAEYETGFARWIARLGNMASQLSANVVFLTYPNTSDYIEANLAEGDYSFRYHYNVMESWDDFIILSSQVGEEDMLMVIGARKGGVSFMPDYENMPNFLSKNFSSRNLVMIIPGQFGE